MSHYVIGSDEYEGFTVDAIFSSLDLAQDYLRERGTNSPDRSHPFRHAVRDLVQFDGNHLVGWWDYDGEHDRFVPRPAAALPRQYEAHIPDTP